jgi:small basic protein (TIGR04137 family)
MSIDRTLKLKNALTRHRNVLSRDERISKLKEEERWADGDSVFGLVKVAHRKTHAAKKEKAEVVEGAEGTTPVAGATTPAAPGAKPAAIAAKPGAPVASGAKPAAGAKAAAPAAKKPAK